VTLRSRLALALVTMAAILVAPLFIAYNSLNHMQSAVRDVQERDLNATLLVARIRAAAEELRQAELQLVYATDSTAPGRSAARVDTALRTLRALSDSLLEFDLDTAHRNVSNTLDRVTEGIRAESNVVQRGESVRADSLSTVLRPVMLRIDSIANTTVATLQARTAAHDHDVRDRGGNRRAHRDLAHGNHQPTRSGPRARHAHGGRRRLQLPSRDRADASRRVWTPGRELSHDGRTIEAARPAEGGVRLGGVARAQDADQRDHRLFAALTLASQAQALSRLVRQLLDVSRFEAGGGKLEPRPLRLGPFLAELESTFRVLAIQRGIRFHVERGSRLPDQVVWDEDRMSEVLGNLLSNAFKFTERGGTVELSVCPAGDTLQLRVQDTGAGIPPENVPHIFDKFFQADNQAAASAKGTGLGLAIAKTIVTAHGGSISVESTQGVGTTFSIVMPTRASGGRHHALEQPRAAELTAS
jgi:signal transduction histidine kinase